MKVCGNDFSDELNSMNKIFGDLDNLIDEIESIKNLTSSLDYNKFEAVLDSIIKFNKLVGKKAKEIRNSSSSNEDLFGLINTLKGTQSKYAELRRVDVEINQYKHYHSVCEKIISAFSSALKLKIQEIHNSIQANVENFYSSLHPGEEHSEIKILIIIFS